MVAWLHPCGLTCVWLSTNTHHLSVPRYFAGIGPANSTIETEDNTVIVFSELGPA
ncbi:hypothetical protein [Bradyrhizobium sp.]|uniref:hypothetical protein n=1 Tax=Bradyrhizobium sp. TaxID=376 RepID=UPI003BB169D5